MTLCDILRHRDIDRAQPPLCGGRPWARLYLSVRYELTYHLWKIHPSALKGFTSFEVKLHTEQPRSPLGRRRPLKRHVSKLILLPGNGVTEPQSDLSETGQPVTAEATLKCSLAWSPQQGPQ